MGPAEAQEHIEDNARGRRRIFFAEGVGTSRIETTFLARQAVKAVEEDGRQHSPPSQRDHSFEAEGDDDEGHEADWNHEHPAALCEIPEVDSRGRHFRSDGALRGRVVTRFLAAECGFGQGLRVDGGATKLGSVARRLRTGSTGGWLILALKGRRVWPGNEQKAPNRYQHLGE